MYMNNIEIKVSQYNTAGIDLSNLVDIQTRLKEDLREDIPLNLVSAAVKVVREYRNK